MPVSDLIVLIVGMATYASVHGLILWTAYTTRKDGRPANAAQVGGASTPSAANAALPAARRA